MLTALERFFPPDHPAAEGHFPGNPIIPGAVLLSEILRAMQNELGLSLSSVQIKSAKFFYPVRPGDRVRIECLRSPSGDIKFNCVVEEKTVLNGQLQCGSE